MYQERMFNLSVIQDPHMQVLELRYRGGISMYVMLPESDLSQVSCHSRFHWRGWLLGYCSSCVHPSALRFQVVGVLKTDLLAHVFDKYLRSTYYVPGMVTGVEIALSPPINIILFK